MDKKFKGWDRRGIRRFNNIVAAVKKNRELNTSKEMEMLLKQSYIRLSGKGVETDNAESDNDEDELNDINGYDGFVRIVRNEAPRNEEITGVTNITPV